MSVTAPTGFTASGVAGSQRGALSLSMITARTPSMKSCRCTTCAPTAYSCFISSAKLAIAAPSWSSRSETFIVCGDFVLSVASVLAAHSPPSASSLSTSPRLIVALPGSFAVSGWSVRPIST